MRSRSLEERLGDLAWVLDVNRPLERAQVLDVLGRIAERLELTLERTRPEAGLASTRPIASPAWSAPEEIERDAPSDARTDVWAIGLIAFRLLSGRSFWSSDRDDFQALAVEVTTSRIPRASERLQEPGAAAVDEWLARCVDRDPAARFARATDAVAMLARALPIGTPVTDRPRVDAARAERRPRSPGVLFAIGLVASLPIALVVFVVGFGAGARMGARPAQEAPRSERRPPSVPAPSAPAIPPMAPLSPRPEPIVEETVEPPPAIEPPRERRHRSGEVLDPWARGIVRTWED